MNSIDDQPLQIRTNKHRCFVFCLGHTSLTSVPGIGKKNQYLLQRSGIHDLSTLYRKYRSINHLQRFQQWLENDVGFTSYQAKMTACGIGSKLGKIKEINTGLTPICCSDEGKRKGKHVRSQEHDEKQKIQEIKSEKMSPNLDEDHYLTGVKSPDHPIFAGRSPLRPNDIPTDLTFTPDRKPSDEISKIKPISIKEEISSGDQKGDMKVEDATTTKTKKSNKTFSSTKQKILQNSPMNSISPTDTNVLTTTNKQKEGIENQSSESPDEDNTTSVKRSSVASPLSTVVSKDDSISIHNRETTRQQQPISFPKTKEDKFHEEVSHVIDEIMTEAAHIVSNNTQPKSKQSPFIPISSQKHNNDRSLQQQQQERTPADVHLSNQNDPSIANHNDKKITNPKSSIKPSEESRRVRQPSIDNQRVKPLPETAKRIDSNDLEHKQSTIIGKLSTIHEASNKKKISLTTLSSLSDSDQSINRNPSSTNQIQSNPMDRNQLEVMSRSLTASSSNTNTLSNSSKRKQPENPTTPVNHTNPSSLSENLKDNPRTNKNLSEKVYSKENSGYQSSASPSSPIACYALWDSISNDEILSRRQIHRRTLMKKKQRSNQSKISLSL